EAERGEQRAVARRVDEAGEDEALDDPAGQHASRQRHDERQVVVEAQVAEQSDGQVHADRDELSVREVDDAHDPEDQGQPHADERVDAPDQEPAGDVLEERDEAVHLSSPRSSTLAQRSAQEGVSSIGLMTWPFTNTVTNSPSCTCCATAGSLAWFR